MASDIDKESNVRDCDVSKSDFGSPYILLPCVDLERQIWGAASIKRGNMLNTAV